MASKTFRRFVLASRPKGAPGPENFKLEEAPLAEPADGQFLVKINYLSVDPYMRGRMSDAKSYVPPVQIGEVMTGGAVGQVVASKHKDYAVGDYVNGLFGWQEYAISDGRMAMKVNPSLAPISTSLGVLGMPGLTAYFGLLAVGQPREGETVVVSAASGAVGGVVGQIAKIKGCRTVGIVGSKAKADYIKNDLGFDAAINYRDGELDAALEAACPKGVDVYFENVGGEIGDAVIRKMSFRGRISVCGLISEYNLEKQPTGPRILRYVLVNRLRIEGFIVFDFQDRYAEALRELAGWVREGRVKYREDIVDGLENTPKAFLRLFSGENIGKQLVRVAAE